MSTAAGHAAVLATPLPGPGARLGLRLEGGVLVAVDLLGPEAAPRAPTSARARVVAGQLEAYFADPLAPFQLDVGPAATGFQQRVREALMRLPPGTTVTYGELARALGSGARAVGSACRRNPLPLVVPCHRVVAASGLGGYAGAGQGGWVAVKGWLLRHEGAPGVG